MTAPSRWLNIMVDIETIGHGPTAPVLAVGLVPFQIHPELCIVAPRSEWVEVRCTLRANVAAGRVADPATVEWWLAQSKAAQEALLREPRHDHLGGFALAIAEAVRTTNPRSDDVFVWAKPPQYDLVALRGLMEQCSVDVPWHHRNEQDLRTLARAAKAAMASGRDGWQEVFEVTCELEHSAVADAAEQAEQVVRFHRRLYRR